MNNGLTKGKIFTPLSETVGVRIAGTEETLAIDRELFRVESIASRMDEESDKAESNDMIIELSASSEEPYKRWWGTEILSHEPEAVSMARVSDGASLLWMHQWDKYIGVITSARIEDKKLKCTVKFDQHDFAVQIYNSIKSGILSKVSIGYQIHEMKLIEMDKDSGEDTYLITKWTPLEVSIVTVPADNTVGVGREADQVRVASEPSPVSSSIATEVESTQESNQKQGDQEIALPKEQTPAELSEKQTNKEIIMEIEEKPTEAQRIETIYELAKRHELPESTLKKLLTTGATIEEARNVVLQYLSEKNQPQSPISVPAEALGLTAKENRRYSISKAIIASLDRNWKNAGFERECSEAIADQLGRPTSGFYVPMRDLTVNGLVQQRATYAVGAPATGGDTVETQLDADSMIMFLRNNMIVSQLGATMLTGLRGNVDIPRQSGTSGVYWIATEGGNVTQDESTFDLVQLRPKTVGVKSAYTRSMLQQSSLDIEAFVREDLTRSVALGIDLACIAGTGAAGQPTGILNQAGVPVVALGANGADPTWASIVALETALAGSNADVGSLSYITNAKVRGKLKTTIKNPSGTDSDWIWEAGSEPQFGMLNGYRAGVTNQVPSDLTKGSGTDLSAIIFGNMADILIGDWGIFELLPNPYGTVFDSGGVEIRALQTVDVQIRHPESFAIINDATTT